MTKTFRCEVDLYRNGFVFRDNTNRLYDRNTKGVYYVGARNPKDAKNILQRTIGFGSITVPKSQFRYPEIIPERVPKLKQGQIVKWDYIANGYTTDIPYATDPIKRVACEA